MVLSTMSSESPDTDNHQVANVTKPPAIEGERDIAGRVNYREKVILRPAVIPRS